MLTKFFDNAVSQPNYLYFTVFSLFSFRLVCGKVISLFITFFIKPLALSFLFVREDVSILLTCFDRFLGPSSSYAMSAFETACLWHADDWMLCFVLECGLRTKKYK